jgi:hypothetical protein
MKTQDDQDDPTITCLQKEPRKQQEEINKKQPNILTQSYINPAKTTTHEDVKKVEVISSSYEQPKHIDSNAGTLLKPPTSSPQLNQSGTKSIQVSQKSSLPINILDPQEQSLNNITPPDDNQNKKINTLDNTNSATDIPPIAIKKILSNDNEKQQPNINNVGDQKNIKIKFIKYILPSGIVVIGIVTYKKYLFWRLWSKKRKTYPNKTRKNLANSSGTPSSNH